MFLTFNANQKRDLTILASPYALPIQASYPNKAEFKLKKTPPYHAGNLDTWKLQIINEVYTRTQRKHNLCLLSI